MAQALAKSDPLTARGRILDAMNAIGQQRAADRDELTGALSDASSVAWLMPIAERLDPSMVGELIWRSLSLRPLRPATEWLDDEVEDADLELAKMLSRYDPAI